MSEARTAQPPWNWPAVIMFILVTVPVVTVFPWYAWTHGFDAFEWITFVLLWGANGMAITAGYHRLWAHRSYEASKPLQIMLMLFGAMALQNSILMWASGHRVHHRHVDDVDHDPYSAKRGLWFSHIGWMLRNHPSGVVDTRNARDLEANPIVRFQHDNYLWLALAMNFGVVLALGLWNGDVWGSLMLAGFMRLFVSHHCTFFINSLAHYWGRRPYTTANTARDNDLLAFFTYGEGYHNYHHLFQWDYRNGIRWWQYDPTKWLIATAAALGFARALKRVPEVQIRQALVERQLERAKERVAHAAAHGDAGRLAELQALLQHELAHFATLTSDWATLQQHRLGAAKDKLLHQWEDSEIHRRVLALEESLREQYTRVRRIGLQPA